MLPSLYFASIILVKSGSYYRYTFWVNNFGKIKLDKLIHHYIMIDLAHITKWSMKYSISFCFFFPGCLLSLNVTTEGPQQDFLKSSATSMQWHSSKAHFQIQGHGTNQKARPFSNYYDHHRKFSFSTTKVDLGKKEKEPATIRIFFAIVTKKGRQVYNSQWKGFVWEAGINWFFSIFLYLWFRINLNT